MKNIVNEYKEKISKRKRKIKFYAKLISVSKKLLKFISFILVILPIINKLKKVIEKNA